MTRVTPREFRRRLLALTNELRSAVRINPNSIDAPLMRRCLELLEDLEDPLTLFVMTSDKGMRTS